MLYTRFTIIKKEGKSMAKQVKFNDDMSERDKKLVSKIKLFSKEKQISFTEAVRQLCEYALTAKKIQKIIE